MPTLRTAERYVAWLQRRAVAILVVSALALLGSLLLVRYRLPLRADFSYLLPQDARAVRDLRALEARTKGRDTALVLVVAPDPITRAAAAAQLTTGLRAISPALVERVEDDDLATRDYFRVNRHLFVPLGDLERARDALRRRIEQAKLSANPLFVDIDDEDDAEVEARAAADQRDLEELRTRRRDAEARLDRSSHVSEDGKVALITVRTPFNKTDAKRGAALLAEIGRVRAQVIAAHPTVQVGVTGGITGSVAEHDALVRGMVLSGLLTGALVGVILVLYLRSATLLSMVAGTLVIATTAAFGAAALTVGHLNAATAFLGAIIAGNGVNYGILLLARYLEERRHHEAAPALAVAIHGTLRPTLVASLGASIAYGSLAGTSFRGFADFAIIGAVGMVLCWIASYVLLPALILRFGRNTRIYRGDPFIGGVLVRVFGFRRPGVVVALAAALAIGAGIVAVRYVATDPFEYDIKNLRSEADDAIESRRWLELSDRTFGRGISGKTYIAARDADQVPKIVAALRRVDDGVPREHQTVGTIQSILDVIPADQDAKLVVLGEIRRLLDDPALDALDDQARAEMRELRPPDTLHALGAEDLPGELRDPLTEKDGRVGLMIAIRPAESVDEWNGRDLIRFSNAVRRLELPDHQVITTSGPSVIFADILGAIRTDGPTVTMIATVGLILMVLIVVGRNLRSISVLCATGLGTLAMVAACALAGIKVNFLDFVALPITLGLGVDYAINIAHRQHAESADPLEPLRTSGSAVFVCSLTTIIGYGSLLVSQNLAIKGFGTASLIGEVACLTTALGIVPALVSLRRRRTPAPVVSPAPR